MENPYRRKLEWQTGLLSFTLLYFYRLHDAVLLMIGLHMLHIDLKSTALLNGANDPISLLL
jgi:hypothetical protein